MELPAKPAQLPCWEVKRSERSRMFGIGSVPAVSSPGTIRRPLSRIIPSGRPLLERTPSSSPRRIYAGVTPQATKSGKLNKKLLQIWDGVSAPRRRSLEREGAAEELLSLSKRCRHKAAFPFEPTGRKRNQRRGSSQRPLSSCP